MKHIRNKRINTVKLLGGICFRVIGSILILSLFIICVNLFASAINAQTICIPRAIGVPFCSGPPTWFELTTGDCNAALRERIDDPRWKTASSITHGGSGATEHVLFRALHHTDSGDKSVYMSWWIKVATEDPASNNRLYIGLRPDIGGTNLLVRINLTSLSAEASSDYGVDVYVVDAAGNFGTPIPDPTWTNNIRVWVNLPDPDTWAVHVNVPIDEDLGEGAVLGDDFNMWYQVLQGTVDIPVISYTWPRAPEFSVAIVDFIETVPAPAGWPLFHLSTGSSDSTCATGGITIDVMDIGSEHPDGSGYISKTDMNTFYARPTNKTIADIPVGNVQARFRLANWGTQADHNDIPDASTNLWKDIPGLGSKTQTPPPDDIPPDGQWDIKGTWELSPEEQALFNGVDRWDHQCMLVELSGSGDLIFLRSSVHRNMNFDTASTFTEDAQISLVDLAPADTPKRDVYLYVQKKNMPGSVSIFPGKKVSVGDRSYENEKEKSKSKSKADEFSFKEECYDERPKIEKIADTKPMLVVHGYYDTGKKIKINGVLRPILRPMTSFGYFINHEGDLEGWKNSLKGAGLINPVPNAPNWYKIAVSNNGTAKITTTIKTIERKFAISARLGRNFPHGDFNTIIDQGLSLNVGLEYMMNRNLSVEAVFGYHTFAEGDFVDSVDILQFSINGRYFYPFMGRVRAFINSGVGFYKIDPGDTEFGFNVGTGFDFYISNQFSLEAAYNYHNIKVGDGYYRFSTAQGGFRFRF